MRAGRRGKHKMSLIQSVFIVSVVGIVGTGLGGVFVAALGTPTKRVLSFLLGFAGGIMVAVVAFDLMPEAFEIGGTFITLASFLIGCVATMAINLFIPHTHHVSSEGLSSKLERTSLVIAMGIAMHNIPEGLAVGAGLNAGSRIGLRVALMIMLHNIPEGIAVAAPLKVLRKSSSSIIRAASLAGTPTLIGGLIGMLIGGVSPTVLAASISFAAGSMLFITFDELIPDCQALAEKHSGTLGAVAGVVVNIVLSTLVGS